MKSTVIAWCFCIGWGAIFCLSISGADQRFSTGSTDPIVGFIDDQIRKTWDENEIKPSPVADDAEWVRRVHLDVVGHVPSGQTVEEFLRDKNPAKRSLLIETLLADPGYVRNFMTYWTNTLIGRVTPEKTNRAALEKFLRESFAKNRPWNEIAYDLISAEGRFDENGAVNYLLAQLQLNPNSEEYVVEATAKTARIFLGLQVQCTQCHNHPFNDWKQNQFWEFNSFFRQMLREDHEKYNPATGRMDDDYSELVHRDFDGPVYYETRAGLMLVAYPKYFGTEVDPGTDTNRRLELAKSITRDDSNKWLAKAMVNRMWGHYFAYGFTRPIDDMGPHNPPSHPELLDRLTDEFIKSGYDLKQLSRWICNSEAYNLSSKFNPKNEIDNPANGEVPLFSHMYVKPLQVEQLFESLLVATEADTGVRDSGTSGDYERRRMQQQSWIDQFLRIFGNDEEEPTLYSGTIPQALLMMNGPLVRTAISGEKGSYLYTVMTNPAYKKDPERIRALYLAALGRTPTSTEMKGLQSMMAKYPDRLSAYQDLYWALLNSNEFIVNH
ncbi:MAG: DUF1549 and DUF1553 domain-containing protein [Planctomycetaceae bacterium]